MKIYKSKLKHTKAFHTKQEDITGLGLRLKTVEFIDNFKCAHGWTCFKQIKEEIESFYRNEN